MSGTRKDEELLNLVSLFLEITNKAEELPLPDKASGIIADALRGLGALIAETPATTCAGKHARSCAARTGMRQQFSAADLSFGPWLRLVDSALCD